MDDPITQLEQRLNYSFRDKTVLRMALTHPSYAAEQTPPTPHNQTLEFLGDAVLQFVVTDLLYRQHPDLDEGRLTKMRSALTNEEALTLYARRLALSTCLLLGRGEARAGGSERASNLADGMEALLAALYLDGGLAPVQTLCEQLAGELLTDYGDVLAWENPKGALQELTQKLHQTPPNYEVLEVSGPDHCPRFEVRVTLNGVELAKAAAGNRKTAEKRAAEIALEKLTAHDTAT
ncbi:MAG: ribonuclease III [Lentisphaerae bacterium RIFOXYB12_FULL_65_16]|nr:MAG: ribonuclease III [Lentisphaerae bacterium RIFOXYA12_64_32]OGV86726.1 MAG: ribonuclease III [Lentisphaerae bacterium RIFOXYB12_FULL_65_16]